MPKESTSQNQEIYEAIAQYDPKAAKRYWELINRADYATRKQYKREAK
ncbi:MAG: hypothetical protein LRZ84_22880 [Desertifilum sp.]|nr:hypothetical protein [Desertifilum sp.]